MKTSELISAFALAAMLGAAACGGSEEPEAGAAGTATVDPAATSGTTAADPTMTGGTTGVLAATDTSGIGPHSPPVPAAGPGMDAATAGGPVGTTSGSSTYGPQGEMPPGNPQPSSP